MVLGIETSCDETAAAVVDEHFHIHSSVVESSIDLHRAFGGVVPELAGRAHVATIGPVIRRALDAAGLDASAPALQESCASENKRAGADADELDARRRGVAQIAQSRLVDLWSWLQKPANHHEVVEPSGVDEA